MDDSGSNRLKLGSIVSQNCTLTILLKKANTYGGGLQNTTYIETKIGNNLLSHKTEAIQPPFDFDETLIANIPSTSFESEALTFTVWKKKWTSKGFKVVGSFDIPLIELYPIIGKETTTKKCELASLTKNLGGDIEIDLTLEEAPYGKIIGMIAPHVERKRSETFCGKALGVLVDFDNKYTDRNVKLIFSIASIIFFALNYGGWQQYSRDLVGIESRIAALKHILDVLPVADR